jgi:hypothetical protein
MVTCPRCGHPAIYMVQLKAEHTAANWSQSASRTGGGKAGTRPPGERLAFENKHSAAAAGGGAAGAGAEVLGVLLSAAPRLGIDFGYCQDHYAGSMQIPMEYGW